MRILLSFDIDGTLETGDPPGPITLEIVIRARELGCIIGSSSDRSITSQRDMWARNNIEVDFVSNKHVLIEIKQRFEADYYLHMGRPGVGPPVRTRGGVRLHVDGQRPPASPGSQ